MGAASTWASELNRGRLRARDRGAAEAAQFVLLQRQDVEGGVLPLDAKPIKFAGLCSRSDGAPACDGPNCCCWSSFSETDRTGEVRPDANRRCLNPPSGFSYVPES